MSRRPALLSAWALLMISAAAATGCGDSGGSDGAAATTTAAAAPSATPTGTAGAASADKKAGGRAIGVIAKEFSFTPASVAAYAGKVKVTLTNAGGAEHELVLLESAAPADSLKVTGGRVSEKGAVGEIPEIEPGKTASHSFTLRAGRYVYVCNIAGHYQGGMYGTLLVQ